MLVCSLKKFPCIRFEPRTSGIERNCSANWATTTALCSLIVLPWLCFVGTPTHTCSFNLATTSVTSKKMPNAYKSCPIMISLEKLNILTPLQTSPINVGDLGKLIAAKGFEKLPKVQKIAQSGHTGYNTKQQNYESNERKKEIDSIWRNFFCINDRKFFRRRPPHLHHPSPKKNFFALPQKKWFKKARQSSEECEFLLLTKDRMTWILYSEP